MFKKKVCVYSQASLISPPSAVSSVSLANIIYNIIDTVPLKVSYHGKYHRQLILCLFYASFYFTCFVYNVLVSC